MIKSKLINHYILLNHKSQFIGNYYKWFENEKKEKITQKIKHSRSYCFRKVKKQLELDVLCIILLLWYNKKFIAWTFWKYEKLFLQKIIFPMGEALGKYDFSWGE